MLKKDNLFLTHNDGELFSFNQDVADVFPDMIQRSVPFYSEILDQMAQISARAFKDGARGIVYDLGCSQGAWVPYVTQYMPTNRYIGYDQSVAMIRAAISNHPPTVQFIQSDITTLSVLDHAGVVACNLVLQFIPRSQRGAIMSLIYRDLHPKGVFFLVEKVHHPDEWVQSMYRSQYHAFKRSNGYTVDQILNKDAALSQVLTTQTQTAYVDQLHQTGFRTIDIFFKWHNFIGWVIKK